MSSELEATSADLALAAFLDFLAVQAALAKLRFQTSLLSEAISRESRAMEHDAGEALALADVSGTAGAAPVYVGRMGEVAASLLGVSEAAKVVVSAADAASLAADESNGAHQNEYQGIFDLAQQTQHPMAKPGFYRNK